MIVLPENCTVPLGALKPVTSIQPPSTVVPDDALNVPPPVSNPLIEIPAALELIIPSQVTWSVTVNTPAGVTVTPKPTVKSTRVHAAGGEV